MNPLQQFVHNKIVEANLPEGSEFGVDFQWDDGLIAYEDDRPPELKACINYRHPDRHYENVLPVDVGEALTAMAATLLNERPRLF